MRLQLDTLSASDIAATASAMKPGTFLFLCVSPESLASMKADATLVNLWDRTNEPRYRGRSNFHGTLLGATVYSDRFVGVPYATDEPPE